MAFLVQIILWLVYPALLIKKPSFQEPLNYNNLWLTDSVTWLAYERYGLWHRTSKKAWTVKSQQWKASTMTSLRYKAIRKSMVDFGVVSGEPACTCKDWVKYHIPCKHLFGVFRLFPQWGWEMLPQSYQQSPYLNVDDQAISDYVRDEPQHYSPENSSIPSSPTVSYSPGLDESQQPESDDGKPDEIPCKVNDCIVEVLKL